MCIKARCPFLSCRDFDVIWRPETAGQAADAIQSALAEKQPLALQGMGSKRPLCPPASDCVTLDLSGLSGVISYLPAEQILTAYAGTPVRDVMPLLAANNQQFSFDPPRWQGWPDTGTLGGMVASGLAGPRRWKAGGVRDHLLGFSAISGRGESFKAGGHVVKNVTGYDLPKLMAGSWGTLAVLTEVTLRVTPLATGETTLVLTAATIDAAAQLLRLAARGAVAVTSLAALTPGLAARAGLPGPAALLRLEGSDDTRAARIAGLAALGPPAISLEGQPSRDLWASLRDGRLFAPGQAVWRLTVAPTQGVDMLEGGEGILDWAGGLVVRPGAPGPATAPLPFGRALFFPAIGQSAAEISYPPPPLLPLMRRIKTGFDPMGILNPGCIVS